MYLSKYHRPGNFFKILIRNKGDMPLLYSGRLQVATGTSLVSQLLIHLAIRKAESCCERNLLLHSAEYSNVLLNFPRTAQRGHGCPAFM